MQGIGGTFTQSGVGRGGYLVFGGALLTLAGEEVGVPQPVIPVFGGVQEVNVAGEHLGGGSKSGQRRLRQVNPLPALPVALRCLQGRALSKPHCGTCLPLNPLNSLTSTVL